MSASEVKSKHIARDLVAGVTVATVLVPQSIAYAALAGLPPHCGLYAAALPPIVAALFASSPYLQTGPVALTSLLTVGALAGQAPPASADYVGLAGLLAVIVGVGRVLMGLLRLGGATYLMSEPVLRGFTAAAGILIVTSQLPSALGLAASADTALTPIASALMRFDVQTALSLALSVGTVILIFALRRVHHLIPGVLVAVIVGIVLSESTVFVGPVVGAVPLRLPDLSLALPWASFPALLLPGIVIALVGFAEPASIARTFSADERRFWDPDREFVSQGAANLAAGFTGGFPVGGSFSRSSLNRLAGARTRWSGAVTGLTVLMFLPVSSVLAPLPKAVLAGVVIASVLQLIRPTAIFMLWRLSKPQFGVAVTTFLLTLALAPHIDRAILVGIAVAVAVHLWRESALGLHAWTEGETLNVAPSGVFWFGSAPAIEAHFRALLRQTAGARTLVIHMGGLGRIDAAAALVLRDLIADSHGERLDVVLRDIPAHATRVLGRALHDLSISPTVFDRQDADHGVSWTFPAPNHEGGSKAQNSTCGQR